MDATVARHTSVTTAAEPANPEPKRTRLTTSVPAELVTRFEQAAGQAGLTVAAALEEALTGWIGDNGPRHRARPARPTAMHNRTRRTTKGGEPAGVLISRPRGADQRARCRRPGTVAGEPPTLAVARRRFRGAAVRRLSRQGGDAPTDRRDVLLGCGRSWITARWRSPRRAGARGCGGSPAATMTVRWPSWRSSSSPRPGAPGIGRRDSAWRADRRRYPARRIPPATLELFYIRAARMGWNWPSFPAPTGCGTAAAASRSGSPRPQMTLTTMRSCWCWPPARTTTRCGYAPGGAQSPHTLTATAMGLASCPLTEPLNDMRSRPDWPARCSTPRRIRRP